MAGKQPRKNLIYCTHCRDEFISYNLAGATCPRCGRRGLTPGQMRARKFGILLVVLLVVGAIVGFFLLRG